MLIIIKIRRPNGEAPENFPPANGRPVGGVQGEAAPSRPTLLLSLLGAREFPAGRRPASREGAGGQRPPALFFTT